MSLLDDLFDKRNDKLSKQDFKQIAYLLVCNSSYAYSRNKKIKMGIAIKVIDHWKDIQQWISIYAKGNYDFLCEGGDYD